MYNAHSDMTRSEQLVGWHNKQAAQTYSDSMTSGYTQRNPDLYKNQIRKILYHDRFFIEQFPPKEKLKNVLDIGCGNGYMASDIKELFPNISIVGIDQSAMLTQGNHFISPDFDPVVAEAHRLPFADETFDFVYSSLLLHWVPNADTIMQDAYRVLKPNGSILISIPDPRYFKTGEIIEMENGYEFIQNAAVDASRPWEEDVVLSHSIAARYYGRPKETYIQILQDAGFNNIRTTEPMLEPDDLSVAWYREALGKYTAFPLWLLVNGKK